MVVGELEWMLRSVEMLESTRRLWSAISVPAAGAVLSAAAAADEEKWMAVLSR